MPSITSWFRLEPRSRRDSIDAGLEARVYDPLWLLGRQWQVNEFKAEDAGSPTAFHLEGDAFQLTRYFAGDLPASGVAQGQFFAASTAPLEVLVQREPVALAPAVNLRFAADSGRYFARLLEAHGAGGYAAGYRSLYPLNIPSGLNDRAARFASALAGRVMDGTKFYKAITAGHPPAPPINAADQASVDSATQEWKAWFESVFNEPGNAPSSWVQSRMEYSFSVSAATPTGEIVLEAPDYRGEALDWSSFHVRSKAALGSPASETRREPLTRTVIPTPVKYPGMPSERWWEFEDSQVDFGGIDTLPGDPVALTLLQFAITYGNDWFVVPIPISVGSICRIASATVTNCFGEVFTVPSFASSSGAPDSWKMFTLAGAGPSELLFVPPAMVTAVELRLLESVLLARDEMANMAWAIEKKVMDATGSVFDRTRPAPKPDERGGPGLTYGLVTAVPENWIPFVPVSESTTGRIRLRRAALAITGGTPPHAAGQIVGVPGALIVADEEVPRSGLTLTRSYRYARWLDGSTCLWIGRKKDAGQGEANSGLQFDSARKDR